MGELALGLTPHRAALLSPDKRYRYWLRRSWGGEAPATFVMLNPSTADAEEDDPTVRRCSAFARAWGCGGLLVVNLYAWRATAPLELRRVDDPVGPDNDEWLARAARAAAEAEAPIVAAWGALAKRPRVAKVLCLAGMDRLECLGTTKDGSPRHPLYLAAESERVPFRGTVTPISEARSRRGR